MKSKIIPSRADQPTQEPPKSPLKEGKAPETETHIATQKAVALISGFLLCSFLLTIVLGMFAPFFANCFPS